MLVRSGLVLLLLLGPGLSARPVRAGAHGDRSLKIIALLAGAGSRRARAPVAPRRPGRPAAPSAPGTTASQADRSRSPRIEGTPDRQSRRNGALGSARVARAARRGQADWPELANEALRELGIEFDRIEQEGLSEDRIDRLLSEDYPSLEVGSIASCADDSPTSTAASSSDSPSGHGLCLGCADFMCTGDIRGCCTGCRAYMAGPGLHAPGVAAMSPPNAHSADCRRVPAYWGPGPPWPDIGASRAGPTVLDRGQ